MRTMLKSILVAMTMTAAGCFCGGAGVGQAEASIYVSDAVTGKPVPGVQLVENGKTLQASCAEPDAQDPTLCTYQLVILEEGMHQVTVSAPGYSVDSVAIDARLSSDVHVAVELHSLQ